MSCSSLRPLYLMTDTGIGSTTAVCSHNQVCIHLSSRRRGVQTVYSSLSLQGTCASWFLEGRQWGRWGILRCKEIHYIQKTFLTSLSQQPNVLAADGGAVMVTCRFSRCGKYFAYAISHLVGNHPICTDRLYLIIWHREKIIQLYMFALRVLRCQRQRNLQAETVDSQMKLNGWSSRL